MAKNTLGARVHDTLCVYPHHYDALHKLTILLGLLQPHQYKQLINTPYRDNIVHTCTHNTRAGWHTVQHYSVM